MDFIKRMIKDWAIPIIIAVVLALLVKQFLFFLVSVPTGSMYPTIKEGDRIFVTRVHNVNNLKRGDIVVFYSKELGKPLIKRLIGLPNEKVEIKKDGSVYINGKKLLEPYVKKKSDKTGDFQVPDSEYLFLGDNRTNSYDSRYWQDPYISKDQIQGKAYFIIYPFNRIGMLK